MFGFQKNLYLFNILFHIKTKFRSKSTEQKNHYHLKDEADLDFNLDYIFGSHTL